MNGKDKAPHGVTSGTPAWTRFQCCYLVGAFPEGTSATNGSGLAAVPNPVGVAVGSPRAAEPSAAPAKSRWEHFWGVFPSILTFLSSVVIGGVGVWFTYSYNMAQLQNQRLLEEEKLSYQRTESDRLKAEEPWRRKQSELQTLKEFIPYIAGSSKEPASPEQRAVALALVQALTTPEISIKLAQMFPMEGSDSYLSTLSSTAGTLNDRAAAAAALGSVAQQITIGNLRKLGCEVVSARNSRRGPTSLPIEPGDELIIRCRKLKADPTSLAKLHEILKTLANVVEIELDDLPIDDDAVRAFYRYTGLRALSVGGTRLTNRGLENIGSLKNLEGLNLERTAVTDAGVRYLLQLNALKSVNLYGTNVGGEGAALLAALPGMERLVLGDGPISEAQFASIRSKPGLRFNNDSGVEGLKPELTLAEFLSLRKLRDYIASYGPARLDGQDQRTYQIVLPPALADAELLGYREDLRNIPGLTLTLSQCPDVSDEGVSALRGLDNLVGLTMAPGVTDDGLRVLETLPNLRSLHLPNSKATDKGMAHLAGLAKLEHLVLEKTSITDAGLHHFNKLTNITNLSLVGARVTGSGFCANGILTSLRVLALNQSSLDDKGLECLKGAGSLRSLLATNTGITAAGIEQLRKALPDLRITARP